MSDKTWYRLDLGNGLDAQLLTEKIRDAVLQSVMLGSASDRGATFTFYDSDAGNVAFYFTPEFASLALHFGAVICDKPLRGMQSINVINQFVGNAMIDHFPEKCMKKG